MTKKERDADGRDRRHTLSLRAKYTTYIHLKNNTKKIEEVEEEKKLEEGS